MNAELENTLTKIFRAVRILSPTSFAFVGEPPVEVTPGDTVSQAVAMIPHLPQDPLVRELIFALYSRCYSREFLPSDPAQLRHADRQADTDLLERLSRANRSRGGWDAGWQVSHIGSGGQIAARKGDRHRLAQFGEWVPAVAFPMATFIGAFVSLHVPRESQQQPGAYISLSEALSDQFDEMTAVRIYVNVSADAAPPLLTKLTTELNHDEVPFRIKCLTDPVHFERSDAFVVYLARRHFQTAARIIDCWADERASQLSEAVPLFTKKVRKGIGIAEEPGNGESFGQHRCRLMAQALVDAYRGNSQTVAARFEALKGRFSSEGLTLDRPYLNPGGVDVIDWPSPRNTVT